MPPRPRHAHAARRHETSRALPHLRPAFTMHPAALGGRGGGGGRGRSAPSRGRRRCNRNASTLRDLGK
eukprot:11213637-Lingulodinium_polyedra.AAC.1